MGWHSKVHSVHVVVIQYFAANARTVAEMLFNGFRVAAILRLGFLNIQIFNDGQD